MTKPRNQPSLSSSSSFSAFNSVACMIRFQTAEIPAAPPDISAEYATAFRLSISVMSAVANAAATTGMNA